MKTPLVATCLLTACVFAGIVPLLAPSPAPRAVEGFPGWPSVFEGRALEQRPLRPSERRSLEGFPGRVGRFTDGEREIVLRWIAAPTRKLHLSSECLRYSGHVLGRERLERRDGASWACFDAVREGAEALRVCERIEEAEGGAAWTDVSGWYWNAFFGRSQGPWWATTVAVHAGHAAAEERETVVEEPP